MQMGADGLQADHVVPVNQFRFVDVPQDRFDLSGWFAGNATGFLRAVIDQATGDLVSIRAKAGNQRTAFEITCPVAWVTGHKPLPPFPER